MMSVNNSPIPHFAIPALREIWPRLRRNSSCFEFRALVLRICLGFSISDFHARCVIILRAFGFSITPRSVIIAVIFPAGVTSNAEL
jgi:hypothetical protein